MPKPKTPAERQADYVARGRALALVLTDPVALRKLERLEATHGGVKAAITEALRKA